MTDLPLASTTPAVSFIETIIATDIVPQLSASKPIANGYPVEEDEDYTIKCICTFEGDDGNTVQCEKCETWQHIICYYAGKPPGADETHHCIECDPRSLDGKLNDRHKLGRGSPLGSTDRKPKKTAAKNPRKKSRAADAQNGWAYDKNGAHSPSLGPEGSPREHQAPAAKRPKMGHRASVSAHSVSLKSALPSSKRSISVSHAPQSPAKGQSIPVNTSDPGGLYSLEFIHLYDNDPGDTPMRVNLFNDIALTRDLSLWSHDVEALAEATNGRGHADIFIRWDQPLDAMDLPALEKHVKVDDNFELGGHHPRWVYLTVERDMLAGSMVGVLRGKIGHMQDYTQDGANRWEDLRHPLPFVFFHPNLPIYIDTRREGTLCRYVRRSCQPNLTMRTFLENGSDYHFCFMATGDLPAGTELTVPWTLDAHMRAFVKQRSEGMQYESPSDIDENYLCNYFSKWLAEYGECACNDPATCTMANYDRRSRTSPEEPCHSNRRQRRGRKNGSHGATASRSGSEALRHADEDEVDDAASVSASSKSKPQSRDITPSNQTPTDVKAAWIGEPISDREKRKIALLEKSELEKHQPAPKKKKRINSGGSTVNIAAANAAKASSHRQTLPGTPSAGSRPRYVDVGTSRGQSGSPVARAGFHAYALPTNVDQNGFVAPKAFQHVLPRKTYTDSGTQTDPGLTGERTPEPSRPEAPRKPFSSLTKRLLMRCHKEKMMMDQARAALQAGQNTRPSITNTVKEEPPEAPGAENNDADGDVAMQSPDLPAISDESRAHVGPEKPRPPDLESRTFPDASMGPSTPRKPPLPTPDWSRPPNGPLSDVFRDPDLHLSFPSNDFSTTSPPTSSVHGTPSNPSALVQSPSILRSGMFPPPTASGVAHPSPIKKKMTLGDYMRRNSTNQQKSESSIADDRPGSSPPSTMDRSPSMFMFTDEARDKGVEGSAVTGTPKAERADPMVRDD